MDLALLSVLRDGLLRQSEAANLRWRDVEFRADGAALIHIPQSKTDQQAEGTVLYIGRAAAEALQAIRSTDEVLDPHTPVFGLSARQLRRRVDAAAKAADLGEGFTGSQRPSRHGPGPGRHRCRTNDTDDRRKMEIIENAGSVHGAPSDGPRRRGQVLPRGWISRVR